MLAAISVLSLVVGALPQQSAPTLLELARRFGGNTETQTLACGPNSRLEDLVARADLVVHGVVISKESRLSDDGRHVLTDYGVQPFDYLRDDPTYVSMRSGALSFTARGGTVLVDGFKLVEDAEYNSRRVALEVGDEAILMATPHGRELPLFPTGVFVLSNGIVKANGTVEGFLGDDPVTSIDQFTARLKALVQGP